MAKNVVLGAGIGGISQASELRKELGESHRILLLNDAERFEFTPSNRWVAVGWRKSRQITIDLQDRTRGDLLRRFRAAHREPCYEKAILKMAGAKRLKEHA